MRYLVLVYLAVAAVTAVENELDKKICEPGRLYKDNCNDCTCSSDGKSRVCTQMLCPSVVTLNSADQTANAVATDVEKKICQPGSLYKEACNDCKCSSDGKSRVCTQMLCSPLDTITQTASPLRRRRQISHNKICEPGKSFKNYCNTCTCGADGFSVICTRKGCPPNMYNEDGTLKNVEQASTSSLLRQRRQNNHSRTCEPEKSFKNYCNTCTCGADGFSVICTRKGCPPNMYNEDGSLKNVENVSTSPLMRRKRQVSHNRACTPGETFKIYCNTCTCGTDGYSVACTRQACVPNMYNEDGTLKNVEQVSTSPLMRQGHQVSHNRACTPGETFKAYCNTCACGTDGFSVICTRQACDPNVYNEDGSLINGQQVPKNDLLRQKRQVSYNRDCTPGETFKIDCNTCWCGIDGYSVSCTRMACIPKKPEDDTVNNNEPIPVNSLLRRRRHGANQCEPGKSFKIDCNSCYCTSEGTPICTAMACGTFLRNKENDLKSV